MSKLDSGKSLQNVFDDLLANPEGAAGVLDLVVKLVKELRPDTLEHIEAASRLGPIEQLAAGIVVGTIFTLRNQS